ncbi:MAG: FAD binding domain-containing protein [Gemmatimonadetes bacterium]|nr:FAD binding domain-containing protein [Gemmatimonadota bacterium]
MSPFRYHRPESMDEALALLQEPGARALGGGTDLLPLMREALAELTCWWTCGDFPRRRRSRGGTTAASASGPRHASPISPAIPSCWPPFHSWREAVRPSARPRCAPWERSVATSANAHAAGTSGAALPASGAAATAARHERGSTSITPSCSIVGVRPRVRRGCIRPIRRSR